MSRRKEIEQRLEEIAAEICEHERGDALRLTAGGMIEGDERVDRVGFETHEEATERLKAEQQHLLDELAITE